MQDPEVSERTKKGLRQVLRAQQFGGQALRLEEDAQYRYFADLGRPYVSWLVVASDALAIREYQHCFLIVGCLGYRGFFGKTDADALARELAAEGYDVLVRPVRAYSTLGWFDDPVLNTFLTGDETSLISTIFHEQAHRVLFVKGDTAFNESFATFVEEEGVRRYLAGRGEDGRGMLDRYRARKRDRLRFRAIVLAGRGRLEALYGSNLGQEAKTSGKKRLFLRMRDDYQKQKKSFKIISYDGWFARALNNAHLVGFQQYQSWTRAFGVLFRREGRDFQRFYQAVRELGDLPAQEREASMRRLESSPASNGPGGNPPQNPPRQEQAKEKIAHS